MHFQENKANKLILGVFLLVITIFTVSAYNFEVDDNTIFNFPQDNLDGFLSSYFMPNNKSVNGNFDFNGGWENGGLSIINGSIFADTGYFFNITSLNVTKANVTFLEDAYFSGRVGIGLTNPDSPLTIYDESQVTLLHLRKKRGDSGIMLQLEQEQAARGSGMSFKSTSNEFTIGVDDDDKFKIADGTQLDASTRLTIDTSGNVGINTTSPNALLHIRDTGVVQFHLERLDSSLFDGQTVGQISFLGGEAGGRNAYAGIRTVADGDWSSGSSPTKMIFSNAESGDLGGTDHMTILANGNVGIGTTNPGHKLDVVAKGTTDTRAIVLRNSADTSDRAWMGVSANDGIFELTNAGGTETVYLHSDGNSYFTGGNVGIGTIDPNDKLDVQGDSRFVGSVAIGVDQSPLDLLHLDNSGTYSLFIDRTAKTVRASLAFGDAGTKRWFIGMPDSDVVGAGTEFQIGTTASGGDAKIWIETNGNVGIGIATPNFTLDVFENSGTAMLIRNGDTNTGANDDTQIAFSFNGGANFKHWLVTRHDGDGSPNNAFDFYTNDGTAAGTFPTNAIHGLTITDGKIGVGTTNPLDKLHVNGTSRFAGNLSMLGNNITNLYSTNYNVSLNCTGTEAGTFCYDIDSDTMRFVTTSGQILQMNQEMTMPVKNNEGVDVLDGSIIYIMGATGNNPNFKVAKADNLSTSGLLGVLTKDCNNNQVCPAVFFALVHEFNTSSFVAGDHLYLSETEAGNFTTTPPEFPNVPVWVATVIRVHGTEGIIFVFPRLDSSNGITINSIGLVGDFIQTDYKIMSLPGHANISQNVFAIEMNGTTGQDIPHLILQPGGFGQASIWVRSGIVAPEAPNCLNNTNRTDSSCYSNEGGFTWNADFNTSIANGADWGITGDLDVIKNAYILGNFSVNSSLIFTNSDLKRVGINTSSPQNTLNVVGDLNVTGTFYNPDFFIPQYIFAHTNANISVLGVGTWTNITFDQEVTAIKFGISHNSTNSTNTTFTINSGGIYSFNFNFDIVDTSAGASDVDVAGRVIYANGTEVPGSVFEVDIIKQEIEAELTHTLLVTAKEGDQLVLQFTASDSDVEISTHGTFGDHPDSVTVVIKKVSN